MHQIGIINPLLYGILLKRKGDFLYDYYEILLEAILCIIMIGLETVYI